MKQKIYTIAFIAIALSLGFQDSFAQQKIFTEVSKETKVNLQKSHSFENLRQYSVYSINIASLHTYLLGAPIQNPKGNTKGLQLEIPLPNGEVELFQIYESSVLTPELAAQHPEINTYAGNGTQHPGYKIRFSLTPVGFSAIILGVNSDAIFFEKIKNSVENNIYKSYFSSDATMPSNEHPNGSRCTPISNKEVLKKISGRITGNNKLANFNNGTVIKNFRLAIAATAEFTAAKGGQSAAYAIIVSYVNEINAVYQSELSVKFTLVSGTNIVYTNAATDPYTANNQETMLGENQTNLDNIIGTANYDIGHVLGDGGASSGGGLANSPATCDDATKAQGASDIGDEQGYAHVFTIQLMAHEMGHQFGMSHTYNSNIPVCTTRELSTSVEPGSGATIMSYGFTCDSDDYSNEVNGSNQRIGPFLNFHVASLTQAINYISTLTCFTNTTTGNVVPIVTTPNTTYTIPKSTPFSLSGNATDGNSDPLTYSWEGTNISRIPDNSNVTPLILGSDTSAPYFRSYKPISSGNRTYPLLSAILNGTNKAIGDKLPSKPTTTTHTLTVRDNAGGVTTKDVTVIIDNSGPFLITNDPSGTLIAGTSKTITWTVNGTTAAPILCTLVDVRLSTDGGLTFPTVVASAVPNSGSTNIIVPNITTSTARIILAPSSVTTSGNKPNIFFDISNVDFAIQGSVPVSLLTFDAHAKEKYNVLLTWATSQEINTTGFDIEISSDGQQFNNLGFVNGHGNSSVTQQYQYQVDNLAVGTYFFRLKIIDLNGQYIYSNVQKLTISASNQSASIYPNPTNNYFKLNPGQYTDKVFSIKIIDLVGKVVLSFPAKKYTAGFEINASGIPDGVYHVILMGNDFSETLKLVKL